ncbi:diaminopimelate decarboxylase [bacterium]|nr:diaminopimelate decarboxylase [bacterium]
MALEYFDIQSPRLKIGSMDYAELIRQFSSPLYVYDAGILKTKYRKLRSAMPAHIDIFYAVKSNPNLSVIRTFAESGAGCDVASYGELLAMQRLHIAPQKIIFTGPGKTEREIEFAMNIGVMAFNCESDNEIVRIESIAQRLNKKIKIGIRVNTDFAIKETINIIGGTEAKKFGIDENKVVDVIRRHRKNPYVEFIGFHIFNASQVLDYRELSRNTENILRMAKHVVNETGINLQYIDIGGGLGIPYALNESELDVNALGKALSDLHSQYCQTPELVSARWILEPGRYLSGESGVLLATVTDVKESRGQHFIITDAGIHHFLRPALIHQNHPVFIANKLDQKAEYSYRVEGPLCTTLDCMASDVMLPKAEIGDTIAFFNAGAYGYSESMPFFLSHAIPAEVMVQDGHTKLIRRRIEPDEYLNYCIE